MALRLGVKSLAAKFKEGGALGTYRGKWLLLSAASAEAEDRLVKKHGIPLIGAILGSDALDVADIQDAWFQKGRGKTNMVHCDFTDLTRTPKDVPVLFTHLYTFDSVDLLFAFPNTPRPFM